MLPRCISFGIVLTIVCGVWGCQRQSDKTPVVVPAVAPANAAIVNLNSEWTSAERADFYHLAEGSELIPRSWFDALTVKGADGKRVPFTSTLESLGFLPDPGNLPVGLTSAPVRGLDPQQELVGLNCAACHVGELEYQKKRYRLDGAPNLVNIRAFYAGLATGLEETLTDPSLLIDFLLAIHPKSDLNDSSIRKEVVQHLIEKQDELKKSLDPDNKVEKLWKLAMKSPNGTKLQDALKDTIQAKTMDFHKLVENSVLVKFAKSRFELIDKLSLDIALMRARIDFLKRLKGVGEVKTTEWGPGRVDAFGSARRFLFEPDYLPEFGVSYPPIWDLYRIKWFHYDSNTNTFLERNIGQALGVGGIADPESGESTINLRNLHKLDMLGQKLRPPQWPKDFPPLDEQLVKAGKEHYKNKCINCHSIDSKWQEELVKLEDAGTEPNRATSFSAKLADGTPMPEKIKGTLRTIRDKALADLSPSEREEILKTTPDTVDWRGTNRYSGRPLKGIWATAPYLHNGSVPTLYDLLEKKRPETFHIGSRQFDPNKVGYLQDDKLPQNFDTKLKGNDNSGHLHGTDLGPQEKRELLEYLKSL